MFKSMYKSTPKEMVKHFVALSILATIGVFVVFFKPITAHSGKITARKNNTLNNHSISGPTEMRISKANQLILEGGREVVEVTGINISGSPVGLGAPLNAENISWEGVGIGISNTSEKTITHIKFGLHLHNSSADASKDPFIPIEFGVDTGLPGNIASDKLRANETATVSIPQARAQYLKQQVTRKASDLARMEISIELVIFDDDTAWRHGLMAKRSKDNPLLWEFITGKYAKNRRDFVPLRKELKSAARQMKGQHSFLPKSGNGDHLIWPTKTETSIGLNGISPTPGGQLPCAYPVSFGYFACYDTPPGQPACYLIADNFATDFPVYRITIREFSCAMTPGSVCAFKQAYTTNGNCN
jgi:hypothetical protein